MQKKIKLFPKFSDFIISDDCIEKIASKSIRLYPVFIEKNVNLKKGIISNEKMRNSGNYIYDYAHYFFRTDF